MFSRLRLDVSRSFYPADTLAVSGFQIDNPTKHAVSFTRHECIQYGRLFVESVKIVIPFYELKHQVNLLCRTQDAILAAYIFGSAARKTEQNPKDIDIAVFLENDSMSSFSLPSFISKAEKKLRYPVDVVVLNRAGETLKYEVRRTGNLVFERTPGMGKKFEVSSRKSYEDFLFLHKRYVNKVLYGSTDG